MPAGAPPLDERDYDDLFVVVVEPDGDSRLLHLHYGSADTKTGPGRP